MRGFLYVVKVKPFHITNNLSYYTIIFIQILQIKIKSIIIGAKK